MAISTLTSTMQTIFRWNAQQNLTGSQYNPITNTGSLTTTYDMGTAAGNTTTGGGDEVFSFQVPVSAGSSATVDLNAMTNLLNTSSVSIARIKGYQVRVLSATQDTSISPAPNASTTVTVTNIGVALPTPMDFASGGSGLTLAITVGATVITGVSIGAAGTGYPKSVSFIVVPVQSGGSGGVISVTTNGSGVPTAVAVVAGGTGYSAATVPSVVAGMYTILTGGVHCYFDPNANGFCLVSSSQKNLKILNNDASNIATCEIDIQAAST